MVGILSAVALPQYNKAVQKTKAAQLQTLLSSVVKAGERYYLDNGKYSISFDDFDTVDSLVDVLDQEIRNQWEIPFNN